MSKYTTGEIAKLCGVTVRTVQYYDTRSILIPTALSEGGRRLYSEEDVRKLRIICFLRDLGIPLNAIGELLSEQDPKAVIQTILDEQEHGLREEIAQRQVQLERVTDLKREVRNMEHFSVASIGDIAYHMESKKKLRVLYRKMLCVGLVIEFLEMSTFFIGLSKGNWLPYALGKMVALALAIWISAYYFNRVDYICPHCHTPFRPHFREALFARHTLTTRKLTCTSCGHHGFCVETYRREEH